MLRHVEIQPAHGAPGAPVGLGNCLGALVEIGPHLVAGAKITGDTVEGFQHIPADDRLVLPAFPAIPDVVGDLHFGVRLVQIQNEIPVVAVCAEGRVGSAVGIGFHADIALVGQFGEYVQEAFHAAVGVDGVVGVVIDSQRLLLKAPHGQLKTLLRQPAQGCMGLGAGDAFFPVVGDLQGLAGRADADPVSIVGHESNLLAMHLRPLYMENRGKSMGIVSAFLDRGGDRLATIPHLPDFSGRGQPCKDAFVVLSLKERECNREEAVIRENHSLCGPAS